MVGVVVTCQLHDVLYVHIEQLAAQVADGCLTVVSRHLIEIDRIEGDSDVVLVDQPQEFEARAR